MSIKSRYVVGFVIAIALWRNFCIYLHLGTNADHDDNEDIISPIQRVYNKTSDVLPKSQQLMLEPAERLNHTALEKSLFTNTLHHVGAESADPNTAPVLPVDTIFYIDKNCPITSHVKILVDNSIDPSFKTRWTLQTFSKDDARKTVGGDEFYVTYSDNNSRTSDDFKDFEAPPSAVAIIQDFNNGDYELIFKTPPVLESDNGGVHVPGSLPSNFSETGTLTIHLDFTCGIGKVPVPLKVGWKTSGTIHQTLNITNVPRPPISTYKFSQDYDFSKYKMIMFFGDSLLRMMATDSSEGSRKKHFFRPNYLYASSVKLHLSLDTLDHWQTHFLHSYNASVHKNWPDVAVIVGSSIWDLCPASLWSSDSNFEPGFLAQGSNFTDHFEACRQLILWIQSTYPGMNIYWRLPTTLHTHRVQCFLASKIDACYRRTMYESRTRVNYLYDGQKTLMQDMNVSYLDFFEASHLSAHDTVVNDGAHFSFEFNQHLLNHFYPSS